jgi:hypothetical protein
VDGTYAELPSFVDCPLRRASRDGRAMKPDEYWHYDCALQEGLAGRDALYPNPQS